MQDEGEGVVMYPTQEITMYKATAYIFGTCLFTKYKFEKSLRICKTNSMGNCLENL